MALERDKYELLLRNEFANHFRRSLFFSRKTKKIFSLVAIEDHDLEWLRKCISSPNENDKWQFFFNEVVSPEKMIEIVKELGG